MKKGKQRGGGNKERKKTKGGRGEKHCGDQNPFGCHMTMAIENLLVAT
jgi:hypothetical protein